MTDLMVLREAVREAWESALDESDSVSIADVVQEVYDTCGDLIAPVQETMMMNALAKMVKDIARAEADNDGGQMSLAGFPIILAIPDGSAAPYYMRATKARWPELLAARESRAENVANAVAKLDLYDDALNKVRPVMEGTDLTLGEAAAAVADDEAPE